MLACPYLSSNGICFGAQHSYRARARRIVNIYGAQYQPLVALSHVLSNAQLTVDVPPALHPYLKKLLIKFVYYPLFTHQRWAYLKRMVQGVIDGLRTSLN